MNRHKRLEQASLLGLIITFIILISLSIRNYYLLNSFDGYLTLGSGVWPTTQLEREWIQYREVLHRVALGEELSESTIQTRRDIAISRVAVIYETSNHPIMVNNPEAIATTNTLEEQLALFEQQAGTGIPTPAEAQELLPLVDNITQTSRDLVNIRGKVVQQADLERSKIIRNLRVLLGMISFILIAVLPLVVWLSRRRLNTNLQQAYTDLQARSVELEDSQQKLAHSNQSLHTQNEQLQTTLDKLRVAMEEQKRLEATVQRIRFPIIPVLQGVVVLPLVGRLTQERMSIAVERALDHLEKNQIRTLLIDVTGTSSLDAATTQQFQTLVTASRLLGVETMLVGVSPALAEELIQADFHYQEIQVFSTLQQAIKEVLRVTPNLR